MSGPAPPADRRADLRTGTLLGIGSAVGYTLANAALREVSRPDDLDWSLWVTLCKAAPVASVAWVCVAARAARGLPALPPRSVLPRLLAIGVLGQLGGNLLFQEALGVLGLALTVPVTFTGIILSGAGFGVILLGEPVGARQAASIALLIAATAALSLAAPDAAGAVIGGAVAPAAVALAVATGLTAGCSFGLMGVMIRKTAGEGVGVAATLAPLTTAGAGSLILFLALRPGPPPISQTTGPLAVSLGIAGAANAAAFFAIAAALRRIPVVRANLLNASQAAMAGVVGVLVFAEPPTRWLLLGIGLTVAGLALLGLREPRRHPPEKQGDPPIPPSESARTGVP